MSKHHYPPVIQQLLGECIIAVVLLTSTLKFTGQLSLQFQSDGALKLLLAKCTDTLKIRAVAQFDQDTLQLQTRHELLQKGKMVVTIEQDGAKEPYQSLIPIVNSSIAANLENYFATSEQLATKIWLTARENVAAGMLLQMTPAKETNIASLERENFWQYAVKLGETITTDELLTLDNETILHRLYHQEVLRIFEPRLVQFACTCNTNRMQNIIAMLGREEVEIILQKKRQVVITCEFCNTEYSFDKIDVEIILREHQK